MGNQTLKQINNVMEHGGDTAADGLGLIPGVNVVSEAARAGLATANMYDRAMDGDFWGAASAGGSAAFHGGAAALNALTGEGGEALEMAKSFIEGGHVVETISDVAGSAEDIVTGGGYSLAEAANEKSGISYVDVARSHMNHNALNAVPGGGHN